MVIYEDTYISFTVMVFDTISYHTRLDIFYYVMSEVILKTGPLDLISCP